MGVAIVSCRVYNVLLNLGAKMNELLFWVKTLEVINVLFPQLLFLGRYLFRILPQLSAR